MENSTFKRKLSQDNITGFTANRTIYTADNAKRHNHSLSYCMLSDEQKKKRTSTVTQFHTQIHSTQQTNAL